jgi:aldehyde:ferredoxin oxidoreductase
LTGIRLDKSGLTRLATNIRNQVQRFNIAHGWSKDMDTLPARFFNEPVGDGRVVRKEDLDYMVADYYRLRCWDEKGSPPEGDEVVL